jgi:hypothetical protein
MRINIVIVGFTLEGVVSVGCSSVAILYKKNEPEGNVEQPLKDKQKLNLLPVVNCFVLP